MLTAREAAAKRLCFFLLKARRKLGVKALMIKASKAAQTTEQAYIKERDNLYQSINDAILKAASKGLSSCNIYDSVYFDDTTKHALSIAGYHIHYIKSDWGSFYRISWGGNKC